MNIEKQANKAKKKFPTHQYLTVRIKPDAKNPFGSTTFEKFLKMKNERPVYRLYIHLCYGYMSFSCPACKQMDTVRMPIDDKLWVEILKIFEIIPENLHKK